MSTGGGGAATNAGIDFQQRVGALLLTMMVTDLEALAPFEVEVSGQTIEAVRFETDDAIDDLVVETKRGRLFIQAKRSIKLSASSNSDFVSVIDQFVKQYLSDFRPGDAYILATSPRSSASIVTDLRKLTVTSRLNELGSIRNPLTKSEQNVLDVASSVIDERFEKVANRKITPDERSDIFRRIHVSSLDIEEGGVHERAILLVLATRTTVDSALVWQSLISQALSLAKARSSIGKSEFKERVSHLFQTDEVVERSSRKWTPDVVLDDAAPAGREVILGYLEDQLALADLQRFADDGTRRVKFIDGMIEFGEGTRWPLIHRTATWTGMKRFLDSPKGKELTSNHKVLVFESQLDPGIDNSVHAKAHAELCQTKLASNPSLLECLGCGRAISEDNSPWVEIDEEGLPYDVGLVHQSCLKATYRVLGGISSEAFQAGPKLTDFDYQSWFEAIFSGQGLFSGISESIKSKVIPIWWKGSSLDLSTGQWCVSYSLENGDIKYVRSRGQVQRLTRTQALDRAQQMNDAFADAASKKDPFCVSIDTDSFGPCSALIKTDPTSPILKVVKAEPRQVTRAILDGNRTCANYYTPLLAIIDNATGEPLVIQGDYVLLTDPLQIDRFLANWRMSGFDVVEFDTVVIRSDEQFDRFVYRAKECSTGVVIDPIYIPSGELVAGVVFMDFAAFSASKIG